MKVMFLGVKPVQFTPRGESVEKCGLTVYYTAESPEVIGLFAGDLWIDKVKTPELYEMLIRRDFAKPVPGDLTYEMIPGRKNPMLVDVKLNA